MALDEPNDQDERYEEGSLTFVMAQDVKSVVDQNGGVSIDYVDDGYRKGYMVNLGSGGGDCSGCGNGGGCG